jgi:hypothetical protein
MSRNDVPAAMKARVLDAARKKFSPTRPSVTVDTILLLLTAAAVALNIFLGSGGVVIGPRSLALVVATALGRGTIALASTWASLARGGSMLGRTLAWLVTTSVVTPVAIVGWTLLAASATADGNAAGSWHCIVTATSIGFGPLAAFLAVQRQGDVAHPVATGAALGVASGAWADFLMVMGCPASSITHRLLCHAAPTAILAAAGAALGAFVIRPNARSELLETDPAVVRMSGTWSGRG